MGFYTRTANVVESPDPSQGGSAIGGVTSDGHGLATASASSSSGGSAQTDRRTARWRDFGAPVPGSIIKIELIYQWSWSVDGSAELNGENGSASCSSSYSLGSDVAGSGAASINGPGPLPPDTYSDSDGNTSVITLPNNTDLSTLQLQEELFATAESGIPGSEGAASAQTLSIVSNIRVEITTAESSPIFIV